MCLVVVCEGIGAFQILPYVAFMVVDFGFPVNDVGYYGGFLTASFFAAQFLSSFGIGHFSDIYGRRPILLCGLLGSKILLKELLTFHSFLFCSLLSYRKKEML